MADMAEYEQMLREGIKAGAAGDPRERYLAHLAPYAETGKLYLGESGVAYQHRISGVSTPMSLDDKAGTATGAEILANWREFAKNNPTYGTDGKSYDWFGLGGAASPTADADKAYQYIRSMYGNVELAPDKLYYTAGEVKGLSDLAEQMGSPKRNGKLLLPWTINEDVPTGGYKVTGVKEAQQALDNSKLVGMEQIRPGELDNAVAGLKEQLGGAFNEAWDKQYAPKLGNLTTEKRQQVRDKAEKRFWDSVDWSQYIKYDPFFGMYAPLGSVKHVNDKGVDWFTERVAPMMPAIAAAVITGNVAAPISAAAGAAATTATGTAVAGTIAAGATQGIVSSAIASALAGSKITGKGILTSALIGGLSPYANARLAQYLTRPGTTALLEAIRQAATNKGRIDPRLVLATVAGSEATHFAGDQFKNAGLAGKFVGGVAGGAVRQGISGGQVDPAALAFAGVGNTGAAGSMMARAASTYQRQQALRQYLQQRRGG